ncbi:hypothetical protein GQR58_016405 [Nymphon striatum]|nr:hypothetical protein GQR58_016405 [Nymphon striatum]
MAEKFQPVSSDLTLKERKEARSLRSVDLSDAEIGDRRNALAHCLVPVKDPVFPSLLYVCSLRYVSPYTVEWTTCLMDWKVSSLEYLVNLRCRVGKVAHFVQVDWKRYEMYLLCPDDTVYGNNISCGIHIASVLGFGVKVEIIQGSLKELSGDVMCWNDYVINRILNYFHVGNKIYETSIHSIGFGVKVEIIQSSLKELSGDDMCWNDYVSIM